MILIEIVHVLNDSDAMMFSAEPKASSKRCIASASDLAVMPTPRWPSIVIQYGCIETFYCDEGT